MPEQLPCAPLSEHVPAEACGDEWVDAVWGCGEGGGAEWRGLVDPLGAEGAKDRCGSWGGVWSVGVLDLPPAGDPGAAWATFDTLLPQILNLG